MEDRGRCERRRRCFGGRDVELIIYRNLPPGPQHSDTDCPTKKLAHGRLHAGALPKRQRVWRPCGAREGSIQRIEDPDALDLVTFADRNAFRHNIPSSPTFSRCPRPPLGLEKTGLN